MKKIISIIMILGLCFTLVGCGNDKSVDENVSNREYVNTKTNEDEGSNNIVNTITVEAVAYPIFFVAYDLSNAPSSLLMTIGYNEKGFAKSMKIKMTFGVKEVAEGFYDEYLTNSNSAFSKMFSNIKTNFNENNSYITADLDINGTQYSTEMNYFKTYSGVKKLIDEVKKETNYKVSYVEIDDCFDNKTDGYKICFINNEDE